ncbi:MAG: hypothetical protein J5585_10670 [Clostridia bacterium]|nr:hypothetical protein [Clostridia bacterium]
MNNNETRPAETVKKPKKKPEAEILLDRQLEMKDKTKKTDIAILACFCAFILFFGVMFFIMPDKTYSETEKRTLKQAPDMSFSRIVSDLKRDLKLMTMTDEEKAAYKSEDNWSEVKAEAKTDASYGDYFAVFADEIGDYYADQFPFRDQLRAVKAAAEIGLLKQENNDVLFAGSYLVKKDTVTGVVKGEDGKMRDRTTQDAVETIKSNVKMISGIEKNLPDTVDIRTAIAGRTVDVARSKLPAIFPYESTHADEYWAAYSAAAAEAGITTVELKDTLRERFEDGEYVYYKTDHHWTSLGAYYAYREIIASFGETPYELEDFDRQVYSKSFIGTSYAKAGASFGGKDTIELFRFEGDKDFTTKITDSSGNVLTTLEAFYNEDVYRDLNDKYSVFIGSDNSSDGGNNAVTLVTKNGETRKKLILIKDSFGNSLVPFLARHFDLVILDMRVYTGDMQEFLSDPDLAHILVAYNMETFMNDDNVTNAAARIIPYFRSAGK